MPQCVKSPTDLVILSANVRSLYCKFEEFQILVSSLRCELDFVCLSETWLTDSTVKLCNLEGFDMFNVTRSGVRGGGVAIYTSHQYNSSMIDHLSNCNTNIESIFVKCSFYNMEIIIGCVYRPPNGDITICSLMLWNY